MLLRFAVLPNMLADIFVINLASAGANRTNMLPGGGKVGENGWQNCFLDLRPPLCQFDILGVFNIYIYIYIYLFIYFFFFLNYIEFVVTIYYQGAIPERTVAEKCNKYVDLQNST